MERFTIRKGIKELAPNGEYIPCIEPMEMFRMDTTVPKAEHLTSEDVWGKYNLETFEMLKKGMVEATEHQICPYFGDKLPYKSVTVVCEKEQMQEVEYWLQCQHGINCISKIKDLDNRKVAIRSNYRA